MNNGANLALVNAMQGSYYIEKCVGKQWGSDSSVAFPIGVKGGGPIGQTLRHISIIIIMKESDLNFKCFR